MRQRAARQADLGRLVAVAAAIQPLQFGLDGGVGGLFFEGAFHVPNGIVQPFLFVGHDAHADLAHKVIRHGHQDALENVGGFGIALGFQIGFAKQAIGFEMFGKGRQDVAAMRDRLVRLAALDERFDLMVVFSQGDFRHGITPEPSMPYS